MSDGSIAEALGASVVMQEPGAELWHRVAHSEVNADEAAARILGVFDQKQTEEQKGVGHAKTVFAPPSAERRAIVFNALVDKRGQELAKEREVSSVSPEGSAKEHTVVAIERTRRSYGVVVLAVAIAAVLLLSLRIVFSPDERFSGGYVVEVEMAAVFSRGDTPLQEIPKFFPDSPIRIRLVPEESVHGEIQVVAFIVDQSAEARRLNVTPSVKESGVVEIATNVAALGLGIGQWELVIAIGRPEFVPSSWKDIRIEHGHGEGYEVVHQRLDIVPLL